MGLALFELCVSGRRLEPSYQCWLHVWVTRPVASGPVLKRKPGFGVSCSVFTVCKVSELVFLKWSPREQWCMCQWLGASAHKWSCLPRDGFSAACPHPHPHPWTSAALHPWQEPGCRCGEGWGHVHLHTKPRGGAPGTCEGLQLPYG